jgi:hypothetical protein
MPNVSITSVARPGKQGAQGTTGARGLQGVQGTSGTQGATGQGSLGFLAPLTLPTGSTPSISSLAAITTFKTNNSSVTTIAALSSGPSPGQIIVLYGNDGGKTTVQASATIKLNGGSSFTLSDGYTITFIGDALGNALELSRSANQTGSSILTAIDGGGSGTTSFDSTIDGGGAGNGTVAVYANAQEIFTATTSGLVMNKNLIIKSPNGTKYKFSVSNLGVLTMVAV